MVRLAQEGEEGKFIYKELVRHMWDDLDVKSKKLGVSYFLYIITGVCYT